MSSSENATFATRVATEWTLQAYDFIDILDLEDEQKEVIYGWLGEALNGYANETHILDDKASMLRSAYNTWSEDVQGCLAFTFGVVMRQTFDVTLLADGLSTDHEPLARLSRAIDTLANPGSSDNRPSAS